MTVMLTPATGPAPAVSVDSSAAGDSGGNGETFAALLAQTSDQATANPADQPCSVDAAAAGRAQPDTTVSDTAERGTAGSGAAEPGMAQPAAAVPSAGAPTGRPVGGKHRAGQPTAESAQVLAALLPMLPGQPLPTDPARQPAAGVSPTDPAAPVTGPASPAPAQLDSNRTGGPAAADGPPAPAPAAWADATIGARTAAGSGEATTLAPGHQVDSAQATATTVQPVGTSVQPAGTPIPAAASGQPAAASGQPAAAAADRSNPAGIDLVGGSPAPGQPAQAVRPPQPAPAAAGATHGTPPAVAGGRRSHLPAGGHAGDPADLATAKQPAGRTEWDPAADPAAAQPSTAQSSTAQSSTAQPGTAQPDTTQLGPAGAAASLAPQPSLLSPPNQPIAQNSPAVPGQPVPPPVAQQLVSPLLRLRAAGDGNHSFTVALHPAELGPVNLHVRLTGDVMTIQLASTSESAHDALREALPQLHQELQAAGLSSAGLSLELSGQATGGSPNFSAPAPRHAEPTAPAPPGTETPAGKQESRPRRTGSGLDRWL
ncbi:MAG: flagellar hook-length control protein FliK [Jatrophihabitantaceae bacterium]